MAKKKTPVAVTTEEVAPPESTGSAPAIETATEAAPTSKPSKATDPITVKFRDGVGEATERTFSQEVHGEGFAALAEEFKVTNASKLIA